MPIFVHILFWSLGILIVVAALVTVIILWVGTFSGEFDSSIESASRKPDPSNSADKGSFMYRHSEGLSWLFTVGATVLWVNLFAFFIQVIAWLYGG